jgi:putative transposase
MRWTTLWPKPKSACSNRTDPPPQPLRALDEVELAALEWVDWHNHQRFHSACRDLIPAEYELIHYGHHPAFTEAEVSTT